MHDDPSPFRLSMNSQRMSSYCLLALADSLSVEIKSAAALPMSDGFSLKFVTAINPVLTVFVQMALG